MYSVVDPDVYKYRARRYRFVTIVTGSVTMITIKAKIIVKIQTLPIYAVCRLLTRTIV